MTRVETSGVINRPIEDVFAVLSDLETYPRWSSTAIEVTTTSAGPIRVGTTARYVGRFFGKRIESESEITDFEPNRRLTVRSRSGASTIRFSTTFQAVEGGTRLTTTIELQPGGFLKLAVPLFAGLGKRQFAKNLAMLKGLMEANEL